MAKAKTITRKATVPLDKNDPRVRAAAAEIFKEAWEKVKAKEAVERAEREAKHVASLNQAENRRAKKRASVKEVVKRLGCIAEPLRALHDTAEQSIASSDGHEAALIVASNLAMICLKRLDDCLVDLGDTPIGSADAWLAGEAL
jgi:hypothetical protein